MALAAALMFASPAIQANQIIRVGEVAVIQQDRHRSQPPSSDHRTLPAPVGCYVVIHQAPALQLVLAKPNPRARDGPA